MDDLLCHKKKMLSIFQNELLESQRQYQEQMRIYFESPSIEEAAKIAEERHLDQEEYDRYVQDRQALVAWIRNYSKVRASLESSIAELQKEIEKMESNTSEPK